MFCRLVVGASCILSLPLGGHGVESTGIQYADNTVMSTINITGFRLVYIHHLFTHFKSMVLNSD